MIMSYLGHLLGRRWGRVVGKEEKQETIREGGLGCDVMGWDRTVENGFVGLSDWISYWYLRYQVGLD